MPILLLESAIRMTLIAAAVALVLRIMRIKTASVLHALWASVVVLMMLLPAWVAWGPRASIAILPPDPIPAIALLPPLLPAGLADATPRTSPVPSPAREGGGYSLVTAVYLFGFGGLLLRLAIGTIRSRRLTGASCVVPVTVGLLHPGIILPESAREWPQAQLDAVLAHEGEHIRRRDPLFQWLALLNRALFWFHPLAWWLERRLSGLAEEACDAAVIAQGHDPRDYSEYLLNLARSVERAGTRIEAVGMAMPGIGLKHRIRQMLSGVPVPRISRPRIACTIVVSAVAAAILAAGTLVHAQSPTPKFEVASVKTISGGGGRRSEGGLHFAPGVIASTPGGITVRQIILEAYHLTRSQLSGGPGWLDSDKFELQAKTEPFADKNAVGLMLQTLLAERFKLMASRGTKEMPVYALTVGKKGPGPTLRKLKEGEDSPSPAGFQSGGAPEFAGHAGGQGTVFKGITMQEFAYSLSRLSGAQEGSQVVGRPVLDRTDLQGQFYVRLVWTGDDDFKGALEDELGLRLESRRAVMDSLVIDHIEKPSEN